MLYFLVTFDIIEGSSSFCVPDWSLQLVFEGRQCAQDNLLCLVDTTLQATACGIIVASTVEKLLCHGASMEAVARAKAHADEVVALRVLP